MVFRPMYWRSIWLSAHVYQFLALTVLVAAAAWWMERSPKVRRFALAGGVATAAALFLWFVTPDAVINCGWTCDLFWWLV